MNKNNNYNQGFISIVLVIGVSTILLSFVYIRSLEVFHFFDMSERKQYRIIAFYNAYNCIDRAVLNTSHDYFYYVDTPIKISELSCAIDLVKKNKNEIQIKTTGNYKNIEITRSAVVKINDYSIESIRID